MIQQQYENEYVWPENIFIYMCLSVLDHIHILCKTIDIDIYID